MKVELAVATICTDGFSNQHHEPAFRLLPQLGVRNVEFNVWFHDVITPRYLDSIRHRCERAGLKPVCLQGNSFGGSGAGNIAKDVGHKLALLHGARRLGCRRIKCTGAPRGTEGGIESVIATLKEIAPAAEELDVLVLVENHAGNVLENIADYEAVFAAIDSTHVGICVDVAHFLGAGVDPHAVLDRFAKRVYHVDLKDNRSFGGGHDVVPYGEGIVEFPALLHHVQQIGYRGYLLIEQAWREPREPVLPSLQHGRDMFLPYELK